MDTNIKDIMNEHGKELSFDTDLVKRIRSYLARFVNKNDDHLLYMGSPLTGVHPLRFTTEDYNEWWDEVLLMDDLSLKSDLDSHMIVSDGKGSVKPFTDFKVASNPFNLSCMWLTNKFINSRLSKRDVTAVTMDLMTILQYKLLSSLDARYYPYPCDKEIATAIHADMSKKFLLKQCNSWGEVVTVRAKDILSDGSIHANTIRKFDNDKAMIDTINDIQGRHRAIYKRVTAMFYKYKESNTRIQSVSANIELSGEVTLRDVSNNYMAFRRSAHDIVSNPKSFVRDELVDIILGVMHTASRPRLLEALEWLSSNYGGRRVGYIEELVEVNIVHAIGYIRSENLKFNDIATILVKLRGIHLAPRQSADDVLKIRELGDRIVKASVKTSNPALKASIRSAMVLYMVLRVLAKDKY